MKTKLKFLVKQSLGKKIKTKWFKIANILVLICLIAIANIDRIVTFFGGDFEEKQEIILIDHTNSYDFFSSYFLSMSNSLGEMKNYEIQKSTENIEKLKEGLKEEDRVIITLDFDSENYLKSQVITYNPIDTITYQLLSTTINQLKSNIVIQTSNMSPEEINALTSPVEIEKITTNEEVENAESQDIISVGVILVIIMPFFFLITMLTQMIGAEINDEKSTRGMEIIISNVSPKVHFLSKIIASTIFVVVQGLLLVVYAILAFAIRMLLNGVTQTSGMEISGMIGDLWQTILQSGVLHLLGQGLPLILILFLASFLLYAILAGVLASMTTSVEDYQQLQTPLMIILLIGYYVAIMASTFEGSLFIKILSFIPMISFLVAPVIFILGQTTLMELFISTIFSVLFCFILFHYGLRIYKVGILNYSSSKLWKKIMKSVKKA